jgi:hypothetical protein
LVVAVSQLEAAYDGFTVARREAIQRVQIAPAIFFIDREIEG